MTTRNHTTRRLVAAALGLFVGLALAGCSRTVEYRPQRPSQAHYRVHHLGTYSSRVDEEKEIEGTIFQTTLSFHLEKKDGGWSLRRKLDTLIARGYHKFSMPNELEKKVDLEFFMDTAFIPARIVGYDSIKAVLGRIQQKDDYRKQLLLSTDTALYRAQWRDWWRVADFLPRGRPLGAGQALPPSDLNAKLETFQVTSALFNGPRPRMKKSCLDYTLYYHRTESLPLLVEQFYFSSLANRKFKRYTHGAALVSGSLQYSVDRKTGLPCFQSKTEVGTMTMKSAEEKLEVPIRLYRYEEDLYE